MQSVSLSNIYDALSQHDNLDAHFIRNRYSSELEEQPLYARTPFKYVTGNKPQKH